LLSFVFWLLNKFGWTFCIDLAAKAARKESDTFAAQDIQSLLYLIVSNFPSSPLGNRKHTLPLASLLKYLNDFQA